MMQASQPDFCCSSNILEWVGLGQIELVLSLSPPYICITMAPQCDAIVVHLYGTGSNQQSSCWEATSLPNSIVCMLPTWVLLLVLYCSYIFFLPNFQFSGALLRGLCNQRCHGMSIYDPQKAFPLSGFTSSAMWFSCNSQDICCCGHAFQIEIFAICSRDFSFCVP